MRVYDPSGAEQLIEFVNAGIQDFELRSSDRAAFSYFERKLAIVHNFTVNRYLKVTAPVPVRLCFIATYVYGADSVEVIVLRRFRDDVLLHSSMASGLVTVYYHVSAAAINVWGHNRSFRIVTRTLIRPFVWFVRHYFKGKDKER